MSGSSDSTCKLETARGPQYLSPKAADRVKPVKPVAEHHYSPAELAKAWGVSVETVRCIFRDEAGVLKIGRGASKAKRGYFTLRIPESVAERVHRRMAA
jgi:hypothetical protein